MKSILNDLAQWKSSIDEAKTKKAEIEGMIKERLKSMKKNYGVDSIEAATKKLAKMNKEKEKLKKEIDSEYLSIKSIMEGIEDGD